MGPALSRGGYTFADTHPQPKGTKLTIPGVLAYSSNVGTIRIADMLGPQRLYEYQQKFGLGQATGEGMPGEATGRLLAPDEWSGSASGSVPIGMSVDATLMQMAAGIRDDRQRRHVRPAAPDQGHHRPGRGTSPRPRRRRRTRC